jgi:ABC-2 type transport system permease protein
VTLLRLEWLRLVRTRRLLALTGVYLFFGIAGPLTARYLGEIVERFGGDVTVIFPDPVAADGIEQYVANAAQIGLLVAVAVAAGALALDGLPEMSIFLRTRVHHPGLLLLPRLGVTAAAVTGAYALGLAAAWYETWVLLGALPPGRLLGGLGLAVLYLVFTLAVVAAAGSRMSTVIGTVGVSVVALLAMPILGIVDTLGRWLPSHLVGAQVALLGDGSFGEYLPAAAVTIALSGFLVAVAVRRVGTAEL